MYNSLLQNESSLQDKIKIFSRISDSEKKKKVLRCQIQTFLWCHNFSVHEAHSSSCLGPAGHMSYRHLILSLKNYLHDALESFQVLLGRYIFSFHLQRTAHILIGFVPPGEDYTQLWKTKDRKLPWIICHSAPAGKKSVCGVPAGQQSQGIGHWAQGPPKVPQTLPQGRHGPTGGRLRTRSKQEAVAMQLTCQCRAGKLCHARLLHTCWLVSPILLYLKARQMAFWWFFFFFPMLRSNISSNSFK